MERRTVQLRLGGQSYRIVTTATDAELKRCVGVMEAKLAEVNPKGRAPHGQAVLLAMLSLVHELEEARAEVDRAETLARETLSAVLQRIDAALEDDGGDGARADDGAVGQVEAAEEAPAT